MVAIKDTEMPKSCGVCPRITTCSTYLNQYVNYPSTRYSYGQDKRPNNCPLVEIVTCKECEHSRTCVIEEKTHRFCNCEKHRLQEVTDDYFCGDGEMKGKE